MNIHEYQAQELFEKYGVAAPGGKVATTPEEAEAIARQLGAGKIVVKAQIHAGGRGKGVFTNGFKGGVHVCSRPEEVREIAAKMLGQVLVTHQTGPEGRLVNKIFVGEAAEIARELYVAVLLDRASSAPVVIASTEGGMDIETVAEHTPEKLFHEPVHPLLGLQPYQARLLASRLGLTGDQAKQAAKLLLAQTLGLAGDQAKQAAKLLLALYKLFIAADCSLVEINPLVITPSGQVQALDAKFNFDDNALFRHPEILALRDTTEEDPREVEASKFGLSYIGLDGNIACLVNGAGLAMATMDIIKYYGGAPANFLDVGGGASKDQVAAAFKIILADPQVRGILVNIFGGIMQCDIIAAGILAAVEETKLSIPLVVRLEGSNVELGKKMIRESGLAVISADSLADGAEKIVAAVKAA